MTKMQMLLAYIHEHPTATNTELSEGLGMSEEIVRTYIHRAKRQGRITPEYQDGARKITVKLEDALPGFRRETLMMMVESYLEDFDATTLYSERIEIGKMILRILERL